MQIFAETSLLARLSIYRNPLKASYGVMLSLYPNRSPVSRHIIQSNFYTFLLVRRHIASTVFGAAKGLKPMRKGPFRAVLVINRTVLVFAMVRAIFIRISHNFSWHILHFPSFVLSNSPTRENRHKVRSTAVP